MTEFFIAKRHILDRKFQSFASIIGVAISLMVFVVSLSISNGLKNNMLNSILSISPHITMEIYSEKQGEYTSIINELEKYNFKNINPRIDGQGLINANGISKTALLMGTNLDKLDIKITQGIKDNEDLSGVLVGEEFLSKMGLTIGDNLNIITSEAKEIVVTIKGIFKTGFYNFDSDLVIFPISTMQILNERGDVATKLSLEVNYPSNVKSLNRKVDELNYNFSEKGYFRSWSMDNQNLLSAIDFEKFVLISILSLIVMISSFAISVILNMIVREKTSDIGILKAMGYKAKNILKIFLYEGIIIGISGIILSIILSPFIIMILKYGFKYFISTTYYIESLPVSISFKELFIVYLSAFILILISSLIPAYKASKMNPTEAIKYNS